MTYTSRLYLYKENLFQTYTRYDMYFKAVLDISSIQRKSPFDHIPDVTYTSKNISKKYLSFLATIINTLKTSTKLKLKNTTPGEQKGEVIVYSVQQLHNLICIDLNLNLCNIKARGQCYVKAIEVKPL